MVGLTPPTYCRRICDMIVVVFGIAVVVVVVAASFSFFVWL